jgi:transposase
VRRLEIFTGAGRRRRWPAAVKAQIVAESFSGAATVSEVARRHGLSGAQLFAWRRQARGGRIGAQPTELPFVPLVMSLPGEGRGPASLSGAVAIEVAGAVLHVPPGLEPASITALIRAVRAAS